MNTLPTTLDIKKRITNDSISNCLQEQFPASKLSKFIFSFPEFWGLFRCVQCYTIFILICNYHRNAFCRSRDDFLSCKIMHHVSSMHCISFCNVLSSLLTECAPGQWLRLFLCSAIVAWKGFPSANK